MGTQMHNSCRVLVTGAGSGVGQGIMKALRASGLPLTIVAADITTHNAALFRADEAVLIPRVERQGALDKVIEIIRAKDIQVLMVGSEFDLEFFSKNKLEIERDTNALVIVPPPKTVEIANDKWLTAEFLRTNGLPYAESFLPVNSTEASQVAKEWGYPIVLKTRRGTSSRHVHIIQNSKELHTHFEHTPQPMLQRVIDIPRTDLGTEYTCSVFKSADGQIVGPFTARRTLRGGTSWHIEVAPFEELYDVLVNIANAMEYVGSLNIQLMLTSSGPIPFELNARFSGTTAVRAHFGFNEPEMAVRSLFYKEEIRSPIIRNGIAMRYHEEVFIDGVTINELSVGHKGLVNRWF
jgi:carbamoyl-phosphate synthase large subunit